MKNVTKSPPHVTQSGENVTVREGADMPAAELFETVMAIETLQDWWQPWSREMVKERLSSAIGIVHRTAGRVGPRGFGSSMPNYLYTDRDLWYQEEQEALERAKGDYRRRRVPPATTHEIALAEEALEWPVRYVTNPDMRDALHLWMLSVAIRKPFKRVLERRGIVQITGHKRRDRAVALIVYGLVMDGVEVRA